MGSNEEVRRLANSKTRVVDARGRTIMPGLIDAHVHLLIAPEIVDERSLRDYERTMLPGILTNFLRHGITTIRSTGDPLPYIAQLRDRMDQALSGPRLIITGPNPSSPCGHPATTVCRNNPFCRRTLAREVENEEQARQVVRELVQAKVDAVKMVVDDLAIEGVPPLFDAIVAALVNETHRNGLRIIAHVSMSRDLEATTHLAELGVDEFVHPPLNYKNIPDSAGISQIAAVLVARKLPVTTTVSFSDGYKDAAGVERTTEGSPYTPAMRQCFERNLNAVGALADAGVKLVLGTDWFNGPVRFDDPRSLPGAQTLHEMELLHRAGLSTSAIVTAATRNAAEALGIVDRVGTIAEGKLADLAVLDGDLLQDFSALQRTVAVFKRGAVVSGSLPNR